MTAKTATGKGNLQPEIESNEYSSTRGSPTDRMINQQQENDRQRKLDYFNSQMQERFKSKQEAAVNTAQIVVIQISTRHRRGIIFPVHSLSYTLYTIHCVSNNVPISVHCSLKLH